MSSLRVCIDVPDLERAVLFFGGTFGWTPIRRQGFVELAGAPVPIDLLPRPAGSKPAPGSDAVRGYARHWTPLHLDVVVDDVDAVVARALARGARLEAGPVDRPFGRIAQLVDPFGHGLCILKMSEQGYDAMSENGERPSGS